MSLREKIFKYLYCASILDNKDSANEIHLPQLEPFSNFHNKPIPKTLL